MNQGPSDPKADDIPMCHPASQWPLVPNSDNHLTTTHFCLGFKWWSCNGHFYHLSTWYILWMNPDFACSVFKLLLHDNYSRNLKSGLFEGPVFKWSGLSYSYSPNHLKLGHFCLNFWYFLTKWRPLVQISNGWASGFQIPLKNRTICNPTSFWQFKILNNSLLCNNNIHGR